MLLLAASLGLLALVGCAVVWRTEARADRIVALLYHRLVSEAEFASFPTLARNFTIPEPRFREHLAALRRAGYAPVSLDQVLDALELGKALPPKPVLITFDDGCESVFSRALPALVAAGFPGALFVTTDADAWIFRGGPDAQRRVSEAEIRALDASGIAIGSHAKTHDPLQTMSAAEIEHELGDSKRWLEGVLGKPVRYFAVPLNWYGDKVRAAAQKLGYRAVCTSDTGTLHPGSDPFHLRRLNVEGWMTAADLHAMLTPSAILQRRVIAFAKRFPARLIGPRLWLPFRRWLFASPIGPLLTLRNLRRILLVGSAALAALLLALLAR